MLRKGYLLLIAIGALLALSAYSVTAFPETTDAAQQQQQTPDIVETVAPSVVQIVTEVLTPGQFQQPVPATGVGTGVILDAEGHILTNNHVVAQAENIRVVLSNDESYPAQLIGRDPNTDVAVIQIDAPGLDPAELGDISQVRVGEEVIAIGHALGLRGGPTVSKGVVSALDRTISTGPQIALVDLIQTDASINPGNSGGPLVNMNAQVIGINTAGIPSGQGIGFAVNINDAMRVATQLIERGFVQRGFLGIVPVNVTPALADQEGLPTDNGIIVADILPGGPASQAGLQVGDVIVQMGGQPINNTGELSEFLMQHLPGETVPGTYFSRNTEMTAEVTLGEQPQP